MTGSTKSRYASYKVPLMWLLVTLLFIKIGVWPKWEQLRSSHRQIQTLEQHKHQLETEGMVSLDYLEGTVDQWLAVMGVEPRLERDAYAINVHFFSDDMPALLALIRDTHGEYPHPIQQIAIRIPKGELVLHIGQGVKEP